MAGIIAIGASHGGVDALRSLIAGLPEDFAVPIVVVLHVGARRSILPSLLQAVDGLTASHAMDGEPIRPGHIHVAPPDHHLLVEDGHLRLSRGPRENWARPAIDPLFRSVAAAYGHDAIGVILTGSLNDGSAGLFEIERRGGIAIVQDPAEAEDPSMPRSALEHVAVDYCVALAEIPPLLSRLTKTVMPKGTSGVHLMPKQDQHFATPVAQTCPDCGGAMREEQLGTITQFSCHIGHVLTAEVLAAANLERLEDDLSVCVRAANERAELCREIACRHEAQKKTASAARWRKAAEETQAKAKILAEFAEKPWYDPQLESAEEEMSPARALRH
jgi:two-component system chemotaxis response regulator CheB